MFAGEYDPSKMCALVLDDKLFDRAITLNQLRGLGLQRALGVATLPEAWELLRRETVDLIFLEWQVDHEETLDFVRRVRAGEAPNRAVPIFMLTARSVKADVVAARAAGVDGYLRKPITASGMQRRVRRVVDDPPEFIISESYVGPSRRRHRRTEKETPPPAPLLGDQSDDLGDVRLELARARVTALEEAARELTSGGEDAIRRTYKAARALIEVAEQIEDSYLAFGGKELVRYLEAHATPEGLDPRAVDIHVAALNQLVHLPEALGAERDRVAQSLRRMVDKKLRANAAQTR